MEQKFHLRDKLFTPPINNRIVMYTKLDHCSNQIDLLMDNVIHACNTCINTEGKGGTNFAEWWTRIKCLLLKMKDNVANPSDFVFITIKNKIFTVVKLQHCKWPKHYTLWKVRLKSLFMLIIFTLYTKHDCHISCSFLASNQNCLSGSQLDEVKKGHHHWIWLEQMKPCESIIVVLKI
jgi:hypothetical protein